MNRFSSSVSIDIISGSGNTPPSAPGVHAIGGDSGFRVVEDDTDSSSSDIFEGVGELALKAASETELMFLDLSFCEIRVCENGRCCVWLCFE